MTDKEKDQFIEIIKNKNPRLSFIKSMIRTKTTDYELYAEWVYHYEQITEEEFELIVKALKEEK